MGVEPYIGKRHIRKSVQKVNIKYRSTAGIQSIVWFQTRPINTKGISESSRCHHYAQVRSAAARGEGASTEWRRQRYVNNERSQ